MSCNYNFFLLCTHFCHVTERRNNGIRSSLWFPTSGPKHLYSDIVLSIIPWEISCLSCEIVFNHESFGTVFCMIWPL